MRSIYLIVGGKVVGVEAGAHVVEDFVPFGSLFMEVFHLLEDEAGGLVYPVRN